MLSRAAMQIVAWGGFDHLQAEWLLWTKHIPDVCCDLLLNLAAPLRLDSQRRARQLPVLHLPVYFQYLVPQILELLVEAMALSAENVLTRKTPLRWHPPKALTRSTQELEIHGCFVSCCFGCCCCLCFAFVVRSHFYRDSHVTVAACLSDFWSAAFAPHPR